VGAAQVVGIAYPLGAVAMLASGLQYPTWEVRPALSPYIDPEDFFGVEDKRPLLGVDLNPREKQAYCLALLHASRVPLKSLKDAARDDLSFVHFWEEPKRHRAMITHIEGRLKKLERYPAPDQSVRDGIKNVYEAWIFPPQSDKPYCVVFTELPAGLKPGKLSHAISASCDAYFFKLYAFKDGRNETRVAPLFIGRTLTLHEMPAEQAEAGLSLSKSWVYAAMAFIAVVIALIVGLSVLFRRGDRETQSRLALSRNLEFVAPVVADYPGSVPPPADESPVTDIRAAEERPPNRQNPEINGSGDNKPSGRVVD